MSIVRAIPVVLLASLLFAEDPSPREGSEFWAFEVPQHRELPPVRNTAWPKNEIDHFVLAALEAEGLEPNTEADRHSLVRRLTLDLTGIPPSSTEVDAFLVDSTPQAWEQLLDRLLASPRYGETWGRHWLDVARYADSNGLDENIALGNAWRYRDYVVRAFNDDRPFDRFIVEQLAGDLLGETGAAHRELLIATGFLSLGPKVLAEGDEQKMEMDIIDEQVDTTGRAFMALTLGCARCHNHKFDPISTADYYALAGIFKSTKTMDSFKRIAKWHENSIATDAELAERKLNKNRVKELEGRAKDLEKQLATKTNADQKRTHETKLKKTRSELERLRASLAAEPASAIGVLEGKATNLRIHVRGDHLDLGREVPRGVPTKLGPVEIPTAASGRLELARSIASPNHPLTARVIVNRVWRWHFGTGLVPTTDNFGFLGKRPRNLALLDWLTRRFIADGWSIKSLHRLIVCSSTYRMSARRKDGRNTERFATKDPTNALLWRFPSRRLDAEAIRDSFLSVSGLLDHRIGGASLTHVKNRAFLFDHTSKDTTSYASRRRSVYLPVIRNHLYDVFELFDFPDPAVTNGDRSTTTVPSQALFMLNSGLVVDASDAIASRVIQKPNDLERIAELFRIVHARAPSGAEYERTTRYLQQYRSLTKDSGHQGAYSALAQALLVSNEFVYLP